MPTSHSSTRNPDHSGRAVRWLARVLVCATFPLIWVGGLVTTYDAGMAVPDWPSTFGYNLFLYPWQAWVGGPFDLFVEHGHRLLGAVTGILTIALVVACQIREQRRWVRQLSWVALALVLVQGVLGGVRVLLDERTLAMAHGCTGPLFFAVAVGLATVTSRRWSMASRQPGNPAAPNRSLESIRRLAVMTTGFSYLQLILGANVRHIKATASHEHFRLLILAHLVMAFVVAVHVGMLAARALSQRRQFPYLAGPAALMLCLLLFQLILGGGTWVVKYGWPTWLSGTQLANAYVVQTNSLTQSLTVTAHVATGSLILVLGTVLSLRAARLYHGLSHRIGAGIGISLGIGAMA